MDDATKDRIRTLLAELAEVGREEKCRTCHCYLDVLRQVREDLDVRGLLRTPEAEALDGMMIGRARAVPSHGCLGCDPCLPVSPFNGLCDLFRADPSKAPSGPPASRPTPLATASRFRRGESGAPPGWPPLPGDYTLFDPGGAGAVCALADDEIYAALRAAPMDGVAIVGTLRTENLGVERLVANVLANPAISWLLLCGNEASGHRPGGTLVTLAANGVDGDMRVVGAPGTRARLVNLAREDVDAFRSRVTVIDRIGERDPGRIARAVPRGLPGSARPAARSGAAAPAGRPPSPDRAADLPDAPLDPWGHFIITVDPARRVIRLEHYSRENRRTATLEGARARDLYLAAIRRSLVSRFDHAAYLGYELRRAEEALHAGRRYLQDEEPAG